MGHPGDSDARSDSRAGLGSTRGKQMLCLLLLMLSSSVAGQSSLRSNISTCLGPLSVDLKYKFNCFKKKLLNNRLKCKF